MNGKDLGILRLYNTYITTKTGRDDVVMWDVLPVRDGERLRLFFESKNSPWRQGVFLFTDRDVVIPSVPNDRPGKKVIWHDNVAEPLDLVCRTNNGFLSVYDVWDSEGRGM